MRALQIALVTLVLALPLRAQDFKRGDCNGDTGVNIADAIRILNYLFPPVPESAPTCLDACDVNDDGSVNITDAVFLLQFFKSGGAVPLPPYSACGSDPSADTLDCASFAPCP